MEHHSLDTLRHRAEVKSVAALFRRREKLERWANVIDAAGSQRYRTFPQLEYASAQERSTVRRDGSPFALAYADPVLREAGLEGDCYGEVVSFFELSEREAHRLFCSCMHGGTVTSEGLSSELRRLAVQERGGGLLSRIVAGFRHALH
jgi:putative hemolysin